MLSIWGARKVSEVVGSGMRVSDAGKGSSEQKGVRCRFFLLTHNALAELSCCDCSSTGA